MLVLRSESSLCCFRCGHCSIMLHPHLWKNNFSALVTLKFMIFFFFLNPGRKKGIMLSHGHQPQCWKRSKASRIIWRAFLSCQELLFTLDLSKTKQILEAGAACLPDRVAQTSAGRAEGPASSEDAAGSGGRPHAVPHSGQTAGL